MVLDTEHSQERRQLKRVTIKLPVKVEGIGVTTFTCETLNLHEQGMAATSTTFLTEGTKVKTTITFLRTITPTTPIVNKIELRMSAY